jgi:glycosyltransferase involved in cell wall biosynthesis
VRLGGRPDATPSGAATGGEPDRPAAPGVRIVLDARPLQDPDRSPTTAAYLAGLLGAFDARPLPGESFAFLLQADLPDPTEAFGRLEAVGRRLLPPTRLLRSGALTVDPFLLRGAALGAAWRAERGGAAGAVFHAAGGAVPVPILDSLPSVVTLLDLAAWELPEAFQRGDVARFGQRLRARLLRDVAAVMVASPEVAREARRHLRIRRERIRVVPLAPRTEYRGPWGHAPAAEEQARIGLPDRYLVYGGRFDARHDLGTLVDALADLAAAGRPRRLRASVPWPPRVLVVGASPDDRASLARLASQAGPGAGDALAWAQRLPADRLAALVAGARATILPVVSEATGLPALDSLAAATPVVASAVGPLPGIVGAAGILVEPRDAPSLARAIATVWSDDRVHAGLEAAARGRAAELTRTWDDVAAETRAVYADVGVPPRR